MQKLFRVPGVPSVNIIRSQPVKQLENKRKKLERIKLFYTREKNSTRHGMHRGDAVVSQGLLVCAHPSEVG
jgi:hypothetical protein